VLADGAVIWSKHEQGRFPEDAEILARLAER
jgi:predicted Rdx family selenoprotein